ncbi:MAG: Trp family transcriptional regulator, partial [Alphaproteobacteria bacterium]
DRFRIAEVLASGVEISYRDLHDKTGVSVTTIGRVARFLHHGFGGYLTVLERLKRGEKK